MIEKSDKESLKKWIINILSHNQFLYGMLSTYNDYEYIDELVNEILNECTGYFKAIDNCIHLESIAYDSDDNIFYTDCNIYLIENAEEILNKKGCLVFFKYDKPEIMWHSYLKFFESKDEAKKYIEIMIKCEASRMDDEIKKLQNLKKKIMDRV